MNLIMATSVLLLLVLLHILISERTIILFLLRKSMKLLSLNEWMNVMNEWIEAYIILYRNGIPLNKAIYGSFSTALINIGCTDWLCDKIFYTLFPVYLLISLYQDLLILY